MITEVRDRTKFLGASEIADVLGMGSGSAYEVWARKTGVMPEKEVTPQMRRGLRIEPLALEDFCQRRGWTPDYVASEVKTQVFLVHPQHSFLAATLDVATSDDEAWEFKSTGYFVSKEWDKAKGLFPAKHALQNTFQRAIAGARYNTVFGGGLVHFPMETLEGEDFPIPYDADLGEMLIEAGVRFWNDHVLAGTPPPLTGTTAEAEAFKARFKEATPGRTVTASPFIEEMVISARQQKVRVKDAEKEYERLKMTIQEFMGDAEELILSDGTAITWKNSKGSPAWKGIAQAAGATPEMIAAGTPAVGPRKFLLGSEEE